MTVSNVRLILTREIRDQLRDRRTLFMVVVLPILLYPLLGMSMFQISQFTQEQTTQVLVVGAPTIADKPPLFENEQFALRLFTDPSRAKLMELEFVSHESQPTDTTPVQLRADAQAQVQSGKYAAAVYFPPDFAKRLDAFREAIHQRSEKQVGGDDHAKAIHLEVSSPEIIYTTANDKSQIAFARLSEVLRRWTEQIGDDNLAASGVSKVAMRPFLVESADVADVEHRGASFWSKVLPILLLIWALTGAFYPAVDLCAGEKERGTLETLLSSPAHRSEIVVGKLLTVMIFSIVTAVLNLLSVGVTGLMVANHLPDLGLPPATALLALAVALVPISALFSALCLALAAFARSTKEGQYYLMPLLLITMPLVILPMSPGVELNLGTSLIPITGVVLLLRSVLEGSYWQALQYSPVVVAVMLAACLMAIRWAVDQFNSESVLFREGERLDLGLRFKHMLRNRQPTPTVAAATLCGVLILVISFFISCSAAMPDGFAGFARSVLMSQLVVIAAPALLMTMLFTSSPRQTLLLKLPSWWTLPAAALLAIVLHPVANLLQTVVQLFCPVNESVQPAIEKMQSLFQEADFWPLVLVLAALPAVCEELAFRGFILSGFRHLGHKWHAIIYSAIFFGFTHGILQQSLIASLLGVLVGFLAVQSGSILPGMVFHVLHNSLAIGRSRITSDMIPNVPLLHKFVAPAEDGSFLFEWPTIVVGSLVAALILIRFNRLSCPRSVEEQLGDAIDRGEHRPAPLVPEEAVCST